MIISDNVFFQGSLKVGCCTQRRVGNYGSLMVVLCCFVAMDVSSDLCSVLNLASASALKLYYSSRREKKFSSGKRRRTLQNVAERCRTLQNVGSWDSIVR